MQKLGITDIKSYYAKLQPLIIFSMVLGAAIGSTADHAFLGLVTGLLVGFAAPAVLIFAAVTLVVVSLMLAVFFAAWMVIWFVAMSLLHS